MAGTGVDGAAARVSRRSRVLVVEDEPKLADALREGLAADGYEVSVERTGDAGLRRSMTETFDVVLLDVTLPRVSGLEILRRIRQSANSLPVVILSALDSIEARVIGLEAGADDYLPKPFAFSELLARLRAVTRRVGDDLTIPLRINGLSLDPVERVVHVDDAPVDLSEREFDLLVYLMRHRGEIVSREALARDVWQERERSLSFDNVVDVYIGRIRRKLGSAAAVLHTLRGVGFILRDDADSDDARGAQDA